MASNARKEEKKEEDRKEGSDKETKDAKQSTRKKRETLFEREDKKYHKLNEDQKQLLTDKAKLESRVDKLSVIFGNFTHVCGGGRKADVNVSGNTFHHQHSQNASTSSGHQSMPRSGRSCGDTDDNDQLQIRQQDPNLTETDTKQHTTNPVDTEQAIAEHGLSQEVAGPTKQATNVAEITDQGSTPTADLATEEKHRSCVSSAGQKCELDDYSQVVASYTPEDVNILDTLLDMTPTDVKLTEDKSSTEVPGTSRPVQEPQLGASGDFDGSQGSSNPQQTDETPDDSTRKRKNETKLASKKKKLDSKHFKLECCKVSKSERPHSAEEDISDSKIREMIKEVKRLNLQDTSTLEGQGKSVPVSSSQVSSTNTQKSKSSEIDLTDRDRGECLDFSPDQNTTPETADETTDVGQGIAQLILGNSDPENIPNENVVSSSQEQIMKEKQLDICGVGAAEQKEPVEH